VIMWALVWFHLTTKIDYYVIGQYETEKICFEEKQKASILVTKSSVSIFCLKLKVD